MNKHIKKVISLILARASSSVIALSTDQNQPIYIDSDSQNLDLNSNTVVFLGNVYLRQGSIRLRADKIVVNRPTKKQKNEIINAYGKPAKFQQTMDDGKKITGQALTLRYEVAKNLLTMQKQALLIQDTGNKIEGQIITYDIEKQLLAAQSSGKERVTTVLQPQTRK